MIKPNYLLLCFTLIGFSSACTNADEESLDYIILGHWSQSSPFPDGPTRVYLSAYHFMPDGTFEHSLKVVEKDGETDLELGYMSLHTGFYQLLKDTLIFDNIRYYGLDGVNETLPKEDLTEQRAGQKEKVRISFNKKRDELTLNKPCADFGSCLTAQVYKRAN